MKSLLIVAITVGIGGLLLAANLGGAKASLKGNVAPPRTQLIGLRPALAPAHTTQQEATSIAEASPLGSLLLKGTGMTARYGAWVSPRLARFSGRHMVKEAARDVWAVTVGGLNIPSHGPIGAPAEYRHYLTITVDDSTKSVVMSTVY